MLCNVQQILVDVFLSAAENVWSQQLDQSGRKLEIMLTERAFNSLHFTSRLKTLKFNVLFHCWLIVCTGLKVVSSKVHSTGWRETWMLSHHDMASATDR